MRSPPALADETNKVCCLVVKNPASRSSMMLCKRKLLGCGGESVLQFFPVPRIESDQDRLVVFLGFRSSFLKPRREVALARYP